MSSEPIFNSRRSAIYATRGMVASSQPLASQAGLEILMAGGTAADAAVATAAALNVTEPTSTGIGGDMFALYYEAKTREVTALNGSGRAPAALTLDLLRKQGFGDALPPFHAHTITVPGAAAGWCDLIERHGSKSMTEIFAPAIRLADQGFPVAPLTSYFWDRGAQRQLKTQPGGNQLLIDGRAPREGEIFRNAGLANTFRSLGEGGKQGFYQGEIAAKIAAIVQQAGGVMTEADLAEHTSTWIEPISTVYRDVRVYECPPNGQGLAALLALNVLSELDLPRDPLSAERLHLIIEALRIAFADTAWYVADPDFFDIPLETLLGLDYSKQRAALIDPQHATLDQKRGSPIAGSDTVYFCVVDGNGNACSFINSNYMGFGTGISPQGTGFTLQNRGHNFVLDANHPNALQPRKRPYHTIIPGMAVRESDGSLYAPFGVMGGFMQPQGHVQVMLAMLEDGLDPQAALDQPRICLEEAKPDSGVLLEDGISDEVMSQLQKMGHSVRIVAGHERAAFGRGQIIRREPSSGVLCGGSDPRADGCAIGF